MKGRNKKNRRQKRKGAKKKDQIRNGEKFCWPYYDVVLDFGVVYIRRQMPMFRRNTLSPSSGLK
jgi:hypothetical protein